MKGYTAWSLLDNFEWTQGYSERFGLHKVDFSDPERPRSVKDSAKWYKSLIARNGWEQPTPSNPPSTKSSTTPPNAATVLVSSILCVLFSTIVYLF